ncbi:MAG TPA: GTP 3',8-cyclase MoaA [Syntrophales bacterium]|nr:GTP 3',8-cyclase MoaA [Syntrophales bacterium]
MIDRYNREINYLRVSVTDRCNLRCSYCMPKEGVSLMGHDDILRYEEMQRIVRIAAGTGISKVRITGGEPLVRRGVCEFIASLASTAGLNDISLTTNGILLADFAEELFASGVKRINISLDSLNAEKYARITRGGDLRLVLTGIAAVQRIGFSPIKINTVAIKGFNEDEIMDFAELSLRKPYQIRFIELMDVGHPFLDHQNRYLSNAVIRELIGRHYRLERTNGSRSIMDGPAEMYKIAGGAGEIGFISPLSEQFCGSCNRLRLTANGRLRACLLSDEDVDLRGPLRSGCSDRDLAELIESVIAKKPIQHALSCDEGKHIKKCMKDMSSIGG